MGEPSQYELDAWRDIEQFQGRVLSRGMATMSSVVGQGAGKIGAGAAKFTDLAKTKVEWTPGAKAALERARGLSARSADLAGKAARHAGEALPDWTGPAGSSMKGALSKASRVGLSPDGVVKKHQKAGHDVARLADVRRLDLEDVDSVRGRGASWYYPAMAAATGAGAGFAITGGSLTVVASAGASAAPSAAAVFGAYAADGAAVLALSSRAVGQIALSYGYDPELPAEKLFVLAVVNAGTAVTASAKHAAFADISKLTQALVRGKTWTVLNESIVARVASKFAGDFTGRLTKQGLGKVVPGVGVAVGATFNWSTLEGIVDAADTAYRRRFLLEKYPHLAADDAAFAVPMCDDEDVDDVEISVVDSIVLTGVVLPDGSTDGDD